MLNMLTKMFYYGNQENMESMPKVAEELIIKNQMGLSRSSSRDKYEKYDKYDKVNNSNKYSMSES